MNAGNEVSKVKAGNVENLSSRPEFMPEADIYETTDAMHVALNIPGVNEKDLDISLDNEMLSITASQAADEAPNGMAEAYTGYRTGVYKRAFSLLAPIDKDKVKAKLSNGVLRLTLPKSERSKPKKIEVTIDE